jgi:hypothetical protein
VKISQLSFEISQSYDEREIESLLELLEFQGAHYERSQGSRYQLHIPEELDHTPFYRALKDCDSISWVGEFLYSADPFSSPILSFLEGRNP